MNLERDIQEQMESIERLRVNHAREIVGRCLVGSGSIFFSALYLTMIFVAALLLNRPIARDLSIVTAGISYLAYLVQYPPGFPEPVPQVFVVLSIAAGFVAGFAFLFGM